MSLFANANNNSSNPPPGAGLFANLNKNNSQQSPSPSLFASAQQNTSAAGSGGGGLFGSAGNAPAPSSGGLLGSQQNQSGGGGGLFGNQQQNTNQQSGGGLFGGASQTAAAGAQQSRPSLSLFSNQNQQQQQQQQQQPQQTQSKPTLFSSLGAPSSSQPQQTSPFANNTSQNQSQQPQSLGASKLPTLTLGQSLTQQTTTQPTNASTVPGVKIDVSNIRGTTRFNDLHEDLQKQIEQIDTFISDQISLYNQCEGMMPHHSANLQSVPKDVDFLNGRMDAVEIALDNDSEAIKAAKSVVAKDADDARRCFRAVEMLKLPQQFHYASAWHGSRGRASAAATAAPNALTGDEDVDASMDLLSFFDKENKEMTARIEQYTRNITEIEEHLRLVEANVMAQGQQLMFRRAGRSEEDRVRELGAVLREFEGGILNVAGKVGALREEVVDVVAKGR